jgi:hypothetical protein
MFRMAKENVFAVCLGLALLAPSIGAAKPSYIVMPYIAEWASITAAQVPWADINYIAEAFALPQANGAMPTFANGQIANLVSTAHSNGTRCVLSFGGASASLPNWNTSTNPTYVATFIANIMGMVGTYGYDGVDIDWEFPNHADWTPAETAQFTALMSGLYDALHNSANPNYKGTAYDGGPKSLSFYITPGYDDCGVTWSTIGNFCDFGTLPGYDMLPDGVTEGPIGGSWTATNCAGNTYTLTVSSNMTRFSAAGFPRSKFVLGMPFYGASGNINAITTSGSHSGFNATTMESTWSSGATVNDSTAFCNKMNWCLAQGFKGIAIWELDEGMPVNASTEMTAIWSTIAGNTCVNAGTPTDSPTATPTRTVTGTRTATRTASPSASPTSSATLTRSPTLTSSPASSATPTVTPTVTPSATRTASPTPTDSRTATPTASPSATPSATPSPTPTATATRTPSPSASPSGTASATPTVTASFTASPLASPTASPTPSPSFSASPSATLSPSATPTATPTASPSASPTVTPTPTPSPIFSATDSPSATQTFTLAPSATPTASLTTTPTATASGTATPSASATASPGAASTSTPTGTARPALAGGPPGLIEGWPVPDPVQGPWLRLLLKHAGPADAVELRIFTKALVLVAGAQGAGAAAAGLAPAQMALPVGLARGLYYLQARARRGSQLSAPLLLRFYYSGH